MELGMADAARPTSFGELLRQHRLEAGLTQAALAERAGVSVRAIQHLERSGGQPQRGTAHRLAGALALTAERRVRFERAGRPEPRHPRAASATAGTTRRRRGSDPAARNNLPVQLTSFVGREREIAEVTHLLGATRLLTLVGAGGVGKTRLALRVAADAAGPYPDGAWLAELASLTDPELVASAVASAVGVREAPGRPLATALAEFVRPRMLLLLLDNCEHLLAACATLADGLLRVGPTLTILATSR